MRNKLANSSNADSDSDGVGGTRFNPRMTLSRPRVHILARSNRASSTAVVCDQSRGRRAVTTEPVTLSTASRNLLKDFKHAASRRPCASDNLLRSDWTSSGGDETIGVTKSDGGQKTSAHADNKPRPCSARFSSTSTKVASVLPRSRKSRPEVLLLDEEVDGGSVELRCDPNLNAVSFRGTASGTSARTREDSVSSFDSGHAIDSGLVHDSGVNDCSDEDEDADSLDSEMDFGQSFSDSSSSLADADMMSLLSDSSGSSICSGSLSPSSWEDATSPVKSPLVADTANLTVGEDAAAFPNTPSAQTSRKSDIPVYFPKPFSTGQARTFPKPHSSSNPRGSCKGVSLSRRGTSLTALSASYDIACEGVPSQADILRQAVSTIKFEVSSDSGIDSPNGKSIDVVRACIFA